MKTICSRDALLNAINTVLKAVSTRTTLPILECILLKAHNNEFKLTSNNLELGIESASIDSEIQEEGSVALEARIFSEIIRKVEGDQVFITVDEENKTEIKCGNSEFKIMGQAGDEFPALPMVEKSNEIIILQNDLKNLIRQTIFSIAVDESKPILTGELIELKNNFMEVVSVDGYRISYKKAPVTSMNEGIKVIVPGKTLSEVVKILSSEEEEKASIYFTDKHILFDIGGSTVVSRLLEGEFIKYEQSFTEDCKTKIIVNKNELISSLERACLISRDVRKTPVKLSILFNKLVITSNTELGTSYDEIGVDTEGDDLDIAFNPKYLIDALKAIDDEKVLIQFTTSLSPCIIKPLDGDSYKYLILPLRM